MTLALQAAQSTSPTVHLDRMREWMLSWSSPDKPKQFRCLHFLVLHCTDAGQNPIAPEGLNPKLLGDEEKRVQEVERIAHSLHDAALVVAANFPRPQLFALAGYINASPNTAPIAQLPFRLAPPAETLAGFQDSEPATNQGALAFAMRLAETSTRMAFDNLQRSQDRMERIVEAVQARNAKLEDHSFALREQAETALDRSAVRDVEVYGKKLSINREERMYQALERLVPKILDKWSQGPLGAFAKTLKPEQVMALAATLSPEQRAMLAEGLDVNLDLKLLAQNGGSNGAAS